VHLRQCYVVHCCGLLETACTNLEIVWRDIVLKAAAAIVAIWLHGTLMEGYKMHYGSIAANTDVPMCESR